MNRFGRFDQIRRLSAGCIALVAAGVWGPAQAETVDACAWLTTAQVSAALGIPVDAGVRPNATDPHMCNWRESNKPVGPGRNVMVTVINEKEFENLNKLPMTAPMSGVGDAAVVTHSAHLPAILSVKAGTHYFRILVRSSLETSQEVDERNQALEKNLAAQIMKRF